MSNSIQYSRVAFQLDNIFNIVNKCCVPGCQSNFKKKNLVSVIEVLQSEKSEN